MNDWKKKIWRATGTDTGHAENMSDVYPTSVMHMARRKAPKIENQFVAGDNSFVAVNVWETLETVA